MSNTTPSPNMNMPVPTVSEDPGPDWATNINASLSIVDSHNHSAGQGVQINPDGIDITDDLPMNGNNLTTAKSVRFTAQGSPLATSSDIGCLYESGVDLYYNDGSGNQIRITQSGGVTGATGTITGLPSGTASASYAAGIFTFQSATSTPATMAVGPLVIGRVAVSSKTVTIAPSVSQASDYNMFTPIALPSVTSLLSIDSSGNMGVATAIRTGTQASTFTFNGTGSPGTTSSVTVVIQLVGTFVTIFCPAITATSGVNSTALISNSNLPSWACPLTGTAFSRGPTDITSNAVSTTSPGLFTVTTGGVMTLYRDFVPTAWANSASGGNDKPFQVTYYVGTGS